MKKLIFSTFILAALFSCKKNETADRLEIPEAPKQISNTAVKVPNGNLAEINQSQLEAMLAPKNNDTIYVTNFFATWCGPCKMELPDFKEKMEELKGKPVKFTFVSLDAKEEWNTTVRDFAKEKELTEHILLFDAAAISPEYFKTITNTWDGGSIPFTVVKKGNRADETVGMLTRDALNAKLESFK